MCVREPGRGFLAARVGWKRFCSLGRILLALLTIFQLAVSCLAQTTSAVEVAARIDRHYNALRSLQVNFTQHYDGLGQHRQESGVLLLKKPGKMRWTYDQPAGKLFVLDGKNAYFYAPGQTEVQRVPAKKLDDLRSPLRFLLGRAELAKELTNLQLSSHGQTYQLSGVPKDMAQRVSSLDFSVSPDGAIHGIKIEEVDGSITSFTFSGEQPNAAATDADFIFHAPPGTSIVEGLPPS